MEKKFLLQIAVLFIFAANSCAQISGLKETLPASAKVSEERLLRIDKMLQQSIDSGWH